MQNEMKIVMMDINDVHPYENNPRHNENAVADVATSIKKYGFKQPIVVDKDGIIVVGHTRYAAALQLGYTEVPVVVSELSDEQNREYRIVDNKTNEEAMWDYLKLDIESADLDFGDFNFKLNVAFDEQDSDSEAEPESNSDIDWQDVEELNEESYEEPEHRMLECPNCHHVDRDIHFKKVQ